jgi:voltage-gated potassium channel
VSDASARVPSRAVDAPELPKQNLTLRDRYLTFIVRHDLAWEVGMAFLALVYVAVGFAADGAPAQYQAVLAVSELALTVVFLAEFATRLAASHDRWAYLRGHWVDAVALLPVARGLRVFRLIRMLRLIRAFAGLHRAMTGMERLAKHKGTGTIVVALLATWVIASAAFYAVEAGTNPNVREPMDAIWWGISTLVGGQTNITPVTPEGRLASVTLLLIGVALLAGLTATIVSFVVSSGRDRHRSPDAHLDDLARLRDAGVLTEAEFRELVVRVSDRL